jgi:hypothetical protein
MFSIKYNRTTNHIAGIAERTVSNQSAENANRYGAVAYYAENACGTLTRSRLADGRAYESLAEALDAAKAAGGRKLCKNCLKAAEAALAAAEAATEAPTVDEVTETPETLTFKRTRDALGRMIYVAESERFRYVARSAGKGMWDVEVWSLKAVGEIDPVFIADKQIASLCGVSYADAKAEANKYEESKRVPEIAAQNPSEPRIKFKVNRILGSSIVTDEDGSKSFRMIVDEAVRGPVGLIFTEDEALWLFADIMDRQKEFRAWQAEAGE